MSKTMKSCLVVSYGPVPTPQYQTVEGGGLRAWGLAEGLRRNGVRVTVAINNSFPQELASHQDILLVNWGQDQQFIDLINSYDAVIVSYCMGSDSVFIAKNINDSVQLILDAYVPIYVEVSARESKDLDFEYRHYMEDVKRFNHVLRRGDYFLCANEVQKTFYIGVLSSLGIINPRSYREDRIIVAPFGIHDIPAKASDDPFAALGISESDFRVMWFGGLYPWFRIEELLDAMRTLSKHPDFKFVIVGGKNPFNPNPDFSRQYDKAYAFAKEHKLLNKSVFFVDWVDFDKRVNWYKHADLVISLNQPGEENGFSWRTRVMDFVWGELAIITNGGDPLSEDLLKAQAALRIENLSAHDITMALETVHKNPGLLASVRKKVVQLKPNYFWQTVVKPIARVIEASQTPYIHELTYKKELRIPAKDVAIDGPPGRLHRVKKLAQLPRRAYSYARRKGLRRSLKLATDIAKTQLAGRLTPRSRRYVFISNHMNNTGAPVVLMQMIREYAAVHGGRNIILVAPFVSQDLLQELRELGVKVHKSAAALGYRLIKLQLDLRKDDFVLLNTIAVYDQYLDFVFQQLKHGHLAHAYWFIHEDPAQIKVINNDFLRDSNISNIKNLAEKNKLSIITPSKRTRNEYRKIFGTPKVQTIPLLVSIPEKYKKPRTAADFKKLRFFISGYAADGRKGQLIAISAFYNFLERHYRKNPKQYRDFSLTLISIGDDYISQQIRWIGQSLLGKRLTLGPMVPHEKALRTAAGCNVTICCSLNETFGLYVAEGMQMGHVILRNNAAGRAEQLHDGVNGLYIDHTDINQFADAIEKLLNKQTISDVALQKMGAVSQSIIRDFDKNNYLQKIEALAKKTAE